MTKHTIGVDISKSHLDVFRLEDKTAERFENSAAGFRALAKWLGKTPSKTPSKIPVARVIFEPTGAYHKAFEAALGGVFPLLKVNPLQARRFAEACGTKAKTDAVDAQMLARMGAALNLEPKAPQSQNARVLKDLHVTRAGLIRERTRLQS
jgi:transposase